MFPFRKIVFPVDYSEPCRAIVPYVEEMSRRFSADLTLVHAYGPEALARSPRPIADPELPEEAGILEQERLRRFAEENFPEHHTGCIAELGEPGCVLDTIVQRDGADLVMLATHGRGPVRRLLLGSVAAKVLHDLSSAVWTGTGSVFLGHNPHLLYKSILCALDDTPEEEMPEAEAALRTAAAFASDYDARLSLVHVVQTPPATYEIDFSRYEKELMEAADLRLRQLKEKAGVDAPHAVIAGPVAEGVREEAVRRGADLIVTGRGRSQGAFSAMLSRLYPIVRHAPCPVLSV
ncbi:MAG TPA: universal stress protein [Bryobacteraceae bacterium]